MTILGPLLTIVTLLLPFIIARLDARREKRNAETSALIDLDISELERQLPSDRPVPPASQAGVRL